MDLNPPLLPRQQETCADKLQAVSLPAFSQSNNTPRCYRLYTEDPTEQAALILFNLLSEPMFSLSTFCSDLVELVVSIRRIEKFLDLYEV